MHEESKQEYGTLIAKKSERLVTALYLVTDLISDNEPIKHGLRKNAVALLSSMNALSQLDVKDRVIEFKMSLKSVTEIISLLHVSITTGIVSDMNGKLLMDGFRSLQLVLEKKQPILTKEMLHVSDDDTLGEGENFSQAVTSSSYDVLTPLTLARLHDSKEDVRRTNELLKQSQILSRLEARERKEFSKGHENEDVLVTDKKEITQESFGDKGGREVGRIVGISDIKKDNNTSPHSMIMQHGVRQQPSISSSFQMRKQSRREQILALFVKGVDVSIKDIASRIRGCSEKTIQRELNALLYDNVIERIGEKRWSRYVLR